MVAASEIKAHLVTKRLDSQLIQHNGVVDFLLLLANIHRHRWPAIKR